MSRYSFPKYLLYSARSRVASDASSARACPILTPGFIRATTPRLLPGTNFEGWNSLTQKSTFWDEKGYGNSKFSGITPTIVQSSRSPTQFSDNVLPTTFGSPPKCDRQNR